MPKNSKNTVTVSARIPPDMLEDIRSAMEVVNAISVSDFVRIALREYVRQLIPTKRHVKRARGKFSKPVGGMDLETGGGA